MKTNLLLILSCICVLIFCCKHDNAALGPQGEVVSKPPLWLSTANAGNHLAYGVYTAIIYQNTVLTPSVIPYLAKEPFGRAVLVMRNAVDGSPLWQWKNYMTDFENASIRYSSVSKNKLVYSNGPRTHCIDLNTGQTLWQKLKRDSLNSHPPTVAINNSYFFCGTVPSDTNSRSSSEHHQVCFWCLQCDSKGLEL